MNHFHHILSHELQDYNAYRVRPLAYISAFLHYCTQYSEVNTNIQLYNYVHVSMKTYMYMYMYEFI